MVVFLATAQRRAEEQMANPGLNEAEGGAVRVAGRHHHLEGQKGPENISVSLNSIAQCPQHAESQRI